MIKTKHVTYGVRGRPILKGIDFQAERGEFVGIIGPNGGGKSTLCQLIPRFYDVTSGAIRIDGVDVRAITQESLRQNVGVVQQEVFLFAASILENIRYGRPGATEEEVGRRQSWRRSMMISWPCPTASTPTWASGEPCSPADRNRESPLRGSS